MENYLYKKFKLNLKLAQSNAYFGKVSESCSYYKKHLNDNPYDLVAFNDFLDIAIKEKNEKVDINFLVAHKEKILKHFGDRQTSFELKEYAASISSKIMSIIINHHSDWSLPKDTTDEKPKERDEIVKLVILTCVWQRHDLTEVVLSYYNRLSKSLAAAIQLDVAVVGSEGDASRRIAERNDCIYMEYPNLPLNEKWEFGLNELRNHHHDAVIIVGSDDLLPEKLFYTYKRFVEDGVMAAGLTDGYFMDISDTVESIYWGGYGGMSRNAGMPWRLNESMGMGRFYSSELLSILNYSLWKGKAINRGLDGRARENVVDLGLLPVTESKLLDVHINGKVVKFGQLGVSLKELGIFAVDVKVPESSVTPMTNFYRSHNSVRRIHNVWDLIEENFDTHLLNDLKSLHSKYKKEGAL
ncbi:hypothetical protein [Idiomarina sp. UBA3162]|uniref:hypothetical protein n=1 Tax=Idiomarina sp. UBA3162 TaxID=1946641 RepID=UPI000C992BB2|nr:hypothetical protein [Idiomarina sp. UBA3162]MAD52455.1 hypothetical protein [Idiomarinaceae bacterium]